MGQNATEEGVWEISISFSYIETALIFFAAGNKRSSVEICGRRLLSSNTATTHFGANYDGIFTSFSVTPAVKTCVFSLHDKTGCPKNLPARVLL